MKTQNEVWPVPDIDVGALGCVTRRMTRRRESKHCVCALSMRIAERTSAKHHMRRSERAIDLQVRTALASRLSPTTFIIAPRAEKIHMPSGTPARVPVRYDKAMVRVMRS